MDQTQCIGTNNYRAHTRFHLSQHQFSRITRDLARHLYAASSPSQEETTMSLDWRKRIALDQETLAGKPVIKGTRISVEFLLELLADGWKEEEILENYPQFEKEDIQSALRYATDILKDEVVYPYP